MTDAAIEAVLRRDRVIVAAALLMLTALAWGYVWWLAADMEMGGMDMSGFRMIPAGMGAMMPTSAPWTATEFAFVFAMWAVMMIGMMTPSATPMILIYARVGRQAARQGKPLAASAYFAAGYLLTWTGFAVAATSAQWALEPWCARRAGIAHQSSPRLNQPPSQERYGRPVQSALDQIWH